MKITFVGNFDVDFSSESHHKKTLESMGHEVIALREGKANTSEIWEEAFGSDLLIWVHTHGWETPVIGELGVAKIFKLLKEADIPTLTYHLDLWKGIAREKDLDEDPFYESIEHFFTVDKLMAEWFNEHTEVKGHYIHAGVFGEEAHIYGPPKTRDISGDLVDPHKTHDVIFVGSKGYHPEWSYRPRLIDWLRETYGSRFTHVGGDGSTGTIRGMRLNWLYADTKVVVGDSLCIGFDYPYYWSDRVYETLGRGGFIIHPYIKGMEEDFEDGKHLVFYKFGDFDDLKKKIDYYLGHDDEREAIRKAGHQHVKANHTYKNRWEAILREIGK